MAFRTPAALEQLMNVWHLEGRPAQAGIAWRRADWLAAFPSHTPTLLSLPDVLDRATVHRVGAHAAGDPHQAEAAFVSTMAWGYGRVGYGRYRTLRILCDNPRAADTLASVAETLATHGPLSAYQRMSDAADARLRWLGPAFGTKFLYFAQPTSASSKALILDRFVAAWLGRNASLEVDPVAWSDGTYARYLDTLHRWASGLACRPDEIEAAIFQEEVSRQTGARRNQWASSKP